MPVIVSEVERHLDRAEWLLQSATSSVVSFQKATLISASVNAAMAFYENLLTAAEMGKIPLSMEDLRSAFQSKVPRFALLEYFRIHDFHRRPIELVPGTGMWSGPGRLKVTQPGSVASLSIAPDGKKQTLAEHNASVKESRPLTTKDFFVSDPVTGEMVDIFDALRSYLEAARQFWKSGVLGK